MTDSSIKVPASQRWATGLVAPQLGRSIHVWTVALERAAGAAEGFEHLLSAEEKTRAERFRFAHLRHAFLVARGALRVILGRYLDATPENLAFFYGPHGKPALAPELDLAFNASHSGELALFAIARGCTLGVDVEKLREIPNVHELARRFFCAEEADELLALPGEEQQRAFFLCWTRKEAYIKATGEGIAAGLDGFRVSLRPDQPARLLHIGGSETTARAWSLHELAVGSGYAAALAYDDSGRTITMLPRIDPDELLHL